MKNSIKTLIALAIVFTTIVFASTQANAASYQGYLVFQNNDWNIDVANNDYSFKSARGPVDWQVEKYDSNTGELKGFWYVGNNTTIPITISPQYVYVVTVICWDGYVDGSTSGYDKTPFMLDIWDGANYWSWRAPNPTNSLSYKFYGITAISYSEVYFYKFE